MEANKADYRYIVQNTLITIEQKKLGLLFLLPLAFCYIIFMNYLPIKRNDILLNTSALQKPALYKIDTYLVYSNKCKIPYIDPFNKDVLKYIEKLDFIPCSKKDDLVYITKNEDYTQAFMHVRKSVRNSLVVCKVGVIVRHPEWSDDGVKYVNNTEFTKRIALPVNMPVMVNCTNKITQAEVFANTYYPVVKSPEMVEKLHNRSDTIKPFSVMVIGVDSVSRGEMVRSMPETRRFLEAHGWIEMLGYTKVGTNTFPNFMAMLAGRNSSYIADGCNCNRRGGLGKCDFIWSEFSKRGFVTLYVEGNRVMSTFNYQKYGFKRNPTDYYFRQYSLAGADLPQTWESQTQYCAGPISETERCLNALKESAVVFKNDPTFSIYWLNHAHGTLNAAGRYDLKIMETFEFLESAGTFNDTLIIFMSDHGLRYGCSYVYTYPGQMENRLPFFFVYLPERFKQEHPDKFRNLLSNSHKLTTAYDIYITIQEILALSTLNYEVKPSITCNSTFSLFQEIPLERSCEDACVPSELCVCKSFEPIDVKNETVQAAANFMVKSIVDILNNNTLAKRCARYKLDHVISSRMYVMSPTEQQLLIVFKTVPGSVFENAINVKPLQKGDERFSSMKEFSRLDKYGPHSFCVGGVLLKTLCYCLK